MGSARNFLPSKHFRLLAANHIWNMPQPAIKTDRLSKLYGEKVAVEDLSLSVSKGEVFGFLGPNGAGKTTSVKMLLGLVKPTSGEGSILGVPLGNHRVRTKVGFLPEHFRFHEWLNAVEFLKLHANLYRMPHQNIRHRIDVLLDLVGLTAHAQKRLSAFSKGMLQRIGLAQALLNDPELVILDEPTSGLDPVGRRLVRDIIRQLRQNGTTVFLNSHLLSEVEITCDRVAFIKSGNVIHTSALNKLMDGSISVEIRAHPINSEIISGLGYWSPNIRRDGDRITMTLENEMLLPDINRYLVDRGASVYALNPQRMSLEDLFIQVVGEDSSL